MFSWEQLIIAHRPGRKGGLVVLVSQGSGHSSHHLLEGGLSTGGEILAQVVAQHNHDHIAQELWEDGRGINIK